MNDILFNELLASTEQMDDIVRGERQQSVVAGMLGESDDEDRLEIEVVKYE